MSDWPDVVLFDFDGVIVNSEPLHFQAFARVLADEHMALTREDYFRELIGFDDKGAIAHVLSRYGRAPDPRSFARILARKSEVMMELIRAGGYRALAGVEELVRGLDYPLAICSGALRREIELMLEGVGLGGCFKLIVAAEDVSAGKPNPEGYLLAMRRMADLLHRPLSAADCLVVEDAPQVIATVRKAGFRTLAVATSHPAAELAEADWVVATLEPRDVARALPQLKMKR